MYIWRVQWNAAVFTVLSPARQARKVRYFHRDSRATDCESGERMWPSSDITLGTVLYQGYCTPIIRSPYHPLAAESRTRDALILHSTRTVSACTTSCALPEIPKSNARSPIHESLLHFRLHARSACICDTSGSVCVSGLALYIAPSSTIHLCKHSPHPRLPPRLRGISPVEYLRCEH